MIQRALLLTALVAVALNAQTEVPDAVKQSPDYYSVRYENECVRVLDYRLKPGQKEAMHTHQPGVSYIITTAKLRTSLSTGEVAEGMINAGDIHKREQSVTHAVENIGDTEAHVIIVEMKR
jgi:quercetin dioxygenase-like cupin family protein